MCLHLIFGSPPWTNSRPCVCLDLYDVCLIRIKVTDDVTPAVAAIHSQVISSVELVLLFVQYKVAADYTIPA